MCLGLRRALDTWFWRAVHHILRGKSGAAPRAKMIKDSKDVVLKKLFNSAPLVNYAWKERPSVSHALTQLTGIRTGSRARASEVRPYGVRRPYLYATSSFKRRVVLKQQFTIEKGYYDPIYNTPYSEPDGLRVYIIAYSSSTAQNY